MPLDTGAFADRAEAGHGAHAARPKVTLDPGMPIGAAMRTARQSLGLSLIEIAETTRVRERHLEAIEAGRIDQLPSRPFTIGYVRAYAKALGLDADATAARYRTEFPSPDDELHTPVGVRHDRQPRSKLWLALAGLAVAAIVGWNVAVRLMAPPPPRAVSVPASEHAMALARANSAQNGPFTVDAPLPAPPEATAPAPYITPTANSTAGPSTATNAAAAGPPRPFVAQGTIYGAATGQTIIQAKKSISLEIRGPGNVVYFARQLAAGEAYRVPALGGLTAQVSNPADAELYVGGVSRGPFTQEQMPLNSGG